MIKSGRGRLTSQVERHSSRWRGERDWKHGRNPTHHDRLWRWRKGTLTQIMRASFGSWRQWTASQETETTAHKKEPEWAKTLLWKESSAADTWMRLRLDLFFFFYNTFKKYLFIYLAASALSCSTHLCCVMRDLSLWHVDSVVAASGLSCSVAYGILVPWPGMEPVSLALEGGFLTTGPQGKPQVGLLTCRTVRQWACVVLRHEQMTNGDLQRKYCFA